MYKKDIEDHITKRDIKTGEHYQHANLHRMEIYCRNLY